MSEAAPRPRKPRKRASQVSVSGPAYAKLKAWCDSRGLRVSNVVTGLVDKYLAGIDERRAKVAEIDGLIAKSSVGEGLRDIKERGIDAHLETAGFERANFAGDDKAKWDQRNAAIRGRRSGRSARAAPR